MIPRKIIYGLVCPIDNEIRYVGQTVSKSARDRLMDHIRESFYVKSQYTHKENWIRKVHTKGHPITIIVLDEAETNEELNNKERAWITKLVNLTNSASGGTNGYIYTSTAKEAMSLAKRGENNPMWGIRKPKTKEWADNISKSLRISEKLKKSRSSKEYREKISAIQSIHVWLVFDDVGNVVDRFKNARQVALYFSRLLNKNMSISNIKNARRFKRPIGKQLSSWFYVSYEEDYESKFTNS